MINSKRGCHHFLKANRRGVSIIELVGTMGLLLVIGATTHRLLGNVTRASQESRMSRAGRLELERLAASVRQDGRSATSVKLGNEMILLRSSNQQVRYQWKQGQPIILRQVLVDDKPAAVDRFKLRVGTTINASVFQKDSDQVRLSVQLSGGESANRLSRFLIEVET